MNKGKNVIPIFFAIDDGYIPFLAVAIKSLIENASKEYEYIIKVLHTNVKENNVRTNGSINEAEGEISQAITKILHQINIASL